MTALELQSVTKRYGARTALDGIDLSVPKGSALGLLGPNGAGKSTTLKLLTGYLAPSTGTARIAGYDTATDRLAASRQLGYLPENGPLYPDMTPR